MLFSTDWYAECNSVKEDTVVIDYDVNDDYMRNYKLTLISNKD